MGKDKALVDRIFDWFWDRQRKKGHTHPETARLLAENVGITYSPSKAEVEALEYRTEFPIEMQLPSSMPLLFGRGTEHYIVYGSDGLCYLAFNGVSPGENWSYPANVIAQIMLTAVHHPRYLWHTVTSSRFEPREHENKGMLYIEGGVYLRPNSQLNDNSH